MTGAVRGSAGGVRREREVARPRPARQAARDARRSDSRRRRSAGGGAKRPAAPPGRRRACTHSRRRRPARLAAPGRPRRGSRRASAASCRRQMARDARRRARAALPTYAYQPRANATGPSAPTGTVVAPRHIGQDDVQTRGAGGHRCRLSRAAGRRPAACRRAAARRCRAPPRAAATCRRGAAGSAGSSACRGRPPRAACIVAPQTRHGSPVRW